MIASDKIAFEDLIEQYKQELSKQFYSQVYILEHARVAGKIYCMEGTFSNEDYYAERSKALINELKEREKNGQISHDYFMKLNSSIKRFEQFYRDGYIKVQRCYERPKLDEPYYSIQQGFLNNLPKSLSIASVEMHEAYSRQFFKYIKENDHCLKSLTRKIVEEYLKYAKANHARSMEKVIHNLKQLFSFLQKNGFVNYIPDFSTMRSISRRRPVLPRFTYDEVKEILSSVDRKTTMGKRDYAILITAIYTGFRLGDIIDLKLTDINWQNSEIVIKQNKTGNFICLPLCTELGNALADYILHARPNHNDEKYIFLKHAAPYTKITANCSGMQILERCYKSNPSLAQKHIGKTFHSLRRSLASWLSMNQTPLPLISEILGHTNLESAKYYLSYDSINMSICCLGLDGIPILKKELSQ